MGVKKDFLGGGAQNYFTSPMLWGWANFDGEHYLALARDGYRPLTYFYFPFYPIVINIFSRFLERGDNGYLFSALFVSHLFFFGGLIGFWKLILLDFKQNVARLAVLLLLAYPTSFYFGSVYTESLFFALVIWSFYFARKKSWAASLILASFASATRIAGVALAPALLAEYLSYKKCFSLPILFKGILIFLFSLLGLLVYIFYLNQTVQDPLAFFHNIGIFGQQRSSNLVILPQVFYRYFFKIIPNLSWNYFPQVFVVFLELASAIVFLLLAGISFFKLRLSYAILLVLGYLLPTLSGSFSSLPRYVLVLFPGFILLALLIDKRSRMFKIVFFSALLACLSVSTALFTRGFWVS